MMKKDYLIIDRSKWRTGGCIEHIKTGKGFTKLLNDQGYMCCLGFRCHQMGIPKESLLNKSLPGSLRYEWDIPDLLNEDGVNSLFTFDAININDGDHPTEVREKLIKKHFKTIGVTVEFTGEYKKKIK